MADTCTLHMLHTNDVHSQFINMPRIATCLRTHRERWEQRGERVLTLDIGDHVDRMDIKSEASFGKTNTEVLNRSGYQYATIGNNEGITLPKKKLDDLYDQANFDVIVGNFLDASSHSCPQWAVPFAIHEWEDLRVGLLALTIPYVPTYSNMGWEVLDPLVVLREQIAVLRPKVDLVVLLSHLGYQTDCQLALEVEGLDVILGAHTHHALQQGEHVEGTLIAQAGRSGHYVGHVRLVWDRQAKRVMEAAAELFPTADYAADERLSSFLTQKQEEAIATLSRPFTALACDFQMNWTEETPFGSFLAASIRQWTGADVGLANGGLLLATLKKGDLSFADLLYAVPHPINPCAVTLSGRQLWDVLEQSIQPEIVQRTLRGCGFRGEVEGWMGVDGVRVRYRAGDKPSILHVDVNGHPLEWDREYRIGTVDMFMYNRLFPQLLQGEDIRYFLPEMLREVIAVTMKDQKLLQNAFSPRWLREDEGMLTEKGGANDAVH